MKPHGLPFFFSILILGSGLPAAGQVSTPESREAILAKASAFEVLPTGASNARFAAAADPFFNVKPEEGPPPAPGKKAVATAAPAPSDRVILRALAEKVRPSGIMQFGQKTLLLFGERRVKVGDLISVPHSGHDYQLEVVKADARTFTLRLNNELISKRIQ